MGNSVARWEGDTLVVDVIGFNDKTWLAGTGTFHSDALHITERYTRVDKDQINYEVTMEDPNVLTKPWTLHRRSCCGKAPVCRRWSAPRTTSIRSVTRSC